MLSVFVSDPLKIAAYLQSGEIGLLVIDDRLFKEDDAPWIQQLKLFSGVNVLLTGEADAHPSAVFTYIPKKHLVVLAHELIAELCPEALSAAGPAVKKLGDDRRRDGRLHKSLRVILDAPYSPGSPSKGKTVDISATGAKVVTSVPLRPHSSMDLKILLPFLADFITTKARVIWSEPAGDRQSYTSGIFFDRLYATDRFHLINFLSRESA